MCLFSQEFTTRPARMGESLVVTEIPSHFAGRGVSKVVVPQVKEKGIQCVCLKDGMRLQFKNLPAAFQQEYSVPANAVALFYEGPFNDADRDYADMFDLQNSEIVPLAQIPASTELTILDPNLPLLAAMPEESEDHSPAELEEEAVLVPVGTRGRIRQTVRISGSLALLALFGYFA